MSEPTKTNMLLFGTPGQLLDDQTEADFLKVFEQAEARKNYYGPVPPGYPHEPHLQTPESEEGS